VIGLATIVILLVAFAAVLAMAETSISRMNLPRALALREEGHRNAALLVAIESSPAPHLNAVYFSVMCVQNGSAILVAIFAERFFADVGIVVLSVAFTLGYFVVVEAMAKTFGILHSARVALTLAPLVWLLGRLLSVPTRGLIGLANVLLPGKGLEQGPYVSEEEIRSMADVAHDEGSVDVHERDLIHSVFEFGDKRVRAVMVPRPDIAAIDVASPLADLQALLIEHGISRVPVYRDDLDHVEGIVHVKDVMRALHEGRENLTLGELVRPVRLVPGSKRIDDLLRDMQRERFHLAMVVDEYGSVIGMVTIEDLLEELVGEIADEHERDEPQAVRVGPDSYRVVGSLAVDELRELLGAELPHEHGGTVAGLMLGALGVIPRQGQRVEVGDVTLTAEDVRGLRIQKVLATRERPAAASGAKGRPDEPAAADTGTARDPAKRL
jgi:CBS domain containing-hemolysin-like protein